MALPGISNANEFYSAHYLESVLAGDIKKVREPWEEEARPRWRLFHGGWSTPSTCGRAGGTHHHLRHAVVRIQSGGGWSGSVR